jgi:hypothetical protein
MKYAVEVASCGMIYLQNFKKIGIDIQTILRFCLSSRKQTILRYNSKYTEYSFVNKTHQMKVM